MATGLFIFLLAGIFGFFGLSRLVIFFAETFFLREEIPGLIFLGL
jgi:hypothetical protein